MKLAREESTKLWWKQRDLVILNDPKRAQALSEKSVQ